MLELPINILKLEITNSEKLVLSFLFQNWIRTKFETQKLPTESIIAESLGLSRTTVSKCKKSLQENVQFDEDTQENIPLLSIDEHGYYFVSIPDNEGKYKPRKDSSAFRAETKCTASWNDIGNFVKMDSETIKNKDLSAGLKVLMAIIKYVWLKPNGEQYKEICYYSEFAKKGFSISEDTLKENCNHLARLGFLEKEMVSHGNWKGFVNVRLHTITDLAISSAKKAEEIKYFNSVIKNNSEEMLDIIEDLPDALKELKDMLASKINEVKTYSYNINEKATEIKAEQTVIQSLSEETDLEREERLYKQFDEAYDKIFGEEIEEAINEDPTEVDRDYYYENGKAVYVSEKEKQKIKITREETLKLAFELSSDRSKLKRMSQTAFDEFIKKLGDIPKSKLPVYFQRYGK